ncbi:MAG: tetratricopeptide repeat protein [Thermoproteota archaeon]
MIFWQKEKFLFSSTLFVALTLVSITASGCSYPSLNAEKYYIKGREAYLQFTPEGFEEAIKNYNKALEKDASYPFAYSGLGEAYSLLGRWKETNGDEYKEYYDKSLHYSLRSLELAPKSGDSHRALALIYFNLMRFDEAEEEAKRAIELNPNDAEAYCILWVVAGKGAEDEYIRKSIELNPNLIMAHYWLAKEYYLEGNHGKAIYHFSRSVEINPKFFLGHYNLGVIDYEMGRDEEAIQEYKRAIDINPTLMPARINLGIVLTRIGRVEEAIDEYKKTLEIEPNFVEVYFNLAVIFESEGRLNEAVEYYKKFVELAPSGYEIFIDIARRKISKLGSPI